MKKLFLFSFVTVSLSGLFGQTNVFCSALGSQLMATQPSTACSQLLNDLVQSNDDREIDVHVNFWVFVPTYTPASSSVWMNPADPVTIADVTTCVATTQTQNLVICPRIQKFMSPVPPMISNIRIMAVLRRPEYILKMHFISWLHLLRQFTLNMII